MDPEFRRAPNSESIQARVAATSGAVARTEVASTVVSPPPLEPGSRLAARR